MLTHKVGFTLQRLQDCNFDFTGRFSGSIHRGGSGLPFRIFAFAARKFNHYTLPVADTLFKLKTQATPVRYVKAP